MSQSISEVISVFMGMRNGTAPKWTPPYVKADGTKVSSRVSFTGYKNLKSKDKSGKDPKKERFSFTAWGTLADSIARCLSVGKGFSCTCEPQQYTIPVLDANGNQVISRDGTPLTSSKVSFLVIGNWQYGDDSANLITAEINAGVRPAFYNVIGHQHNQAWLEICKKRSVKYAWNGNAGPGAMYGFAEVVLPREKGVAIDLAGHQAQYNGVIQSIQQVAQPQPVAQPIQQQVIAAANGPMTSYATTQVTPVQPAPVAQPNGANASPFVVPAGNLF